MSRCPPLPRHRLNVAYGPHERQTLNFWQAPGDSPRPLLVSIHGGGWCGGAKPRCIENSLGGPFLERGISHAAIDYRLSGDAPLPAPVQDAAQALRFMVARAREWNIDPRRIALAGNSAGGCTALWIAFQPDLANPEASDSRANASTRVVAVGAFNPQTTIDPRVLTRWIGPSVLEHPMIWASVGATGPADALERYDTFQPLYAAFSPINHFHKDAPPVMVSYRLPATLPPADRDHAIHHPVFGLKLKARADACGHECHLKVRGGPYLGDFETVTDFLIAKLAE